MTKQHGSEILNEIKKLKSDELKLIVDAIQNELAEKEKTEQRDSIIKLANVVKERFDDLNKCTNIKNVISKLEDIYSYFEAGNIISKNRKFIYIDAPKELINEIAKICGDDESKVNTLTAEAKEILTKRDAAGPKPKRGRKKK